MAHAEDFAGWATKAIHAGQPHDPNTGAVIFPISVSSTFAQASPGVNKGFEYARTGNPTRNAFEQCVAAVEGGKHGLAFASGLAATTTLLHLFSSGDHIVCIDDVYGGTNRYFNRICAPHSGIKFSMVDVNDPAKLEEAITPQTKLIWLETPTNPTLKICDIRAIADRAHKSNILVLVDNTFMSPYFQRPLELGADIVLHSVTKFINGHSDVVMGVIATNSDDLNKRLRFLQNGMGAVPSPFDCFLAMRGLKTLHVRMREHEKNAMAIARFLEAHPKIEKVIYPGLPSHPQHEIAKKQMSGFGGMITIYLKGGLDESRIFMENLKLFALAESLGGVESLVDHPGIMTHASVPLEQRAKLGIKDNLIRFSCGIEDLNDLIADLTQALNHVPEKKA